MENGERRRWRMNSYAVGAALVGLLLVWPMGIQFRNPPWHAYGGLDMENWHSALAYGVVNLVLLLVFRRASRISLWAFWGGVFAQILLIGLLLAAFVEASAQGRV